MIVKANVLDKQTNERHDAWFLVRFDHTPYKKVSKKHRRVGVCSIYYLSNRDTLIDAVGNKIEGQFFASRICGEKYKYFIVDQSISCNEHDNYCKAYSRIVTMQMALHWMLQYQNEEDLLKVLPFKIDNETFKSFVTTLHTQHPQGKEHALSLIHNKDYRKCKDSK